jgi:polar amino acid transport system permease protein
VLSLLAFVGGGILGLALAVARVSRSRTVQFLAGAYIQVIQGTPLLIVLFLSYFGLSILGLQLDPLVAAGISFTLYSSAFLGEIWRGCIQAVPQPQWEASHCLGLTRPQQYLYVILPQAARIALPPTVGFMVQIVKNTSLASVIGFIELARAGQIINNSTFQPFLIFAWVAVIYFALCFPLSMTSRYFERKLHVGK